MCSCCNSPISFVLSYARMSTATEFRFGETPGSFARPKVVVQGTSRDDLNGLEVTVKSATNDRWCVLPENFEKPISVSGTKLHIEYGENITQNVIIEGLEARPELNGKIGTCSAFQVDRGRWPVTVDGATILLRSSSLRDAETGTRPPHKTRNYRPNVRKESRIICEGLR